VRTSHADSRASHAADAERSKIKRFGRAPAWPASALLAGVLVLGLGCDSSDVTDSPDSATPSFATASNVASVTLSPTDTLQVGPVGAKSVMVGRAWDASGKEVNGATLKFWSNSSAFEFRQDMCASPCTDTVLTAATGTGKVILSNYGGSAIRDTAWVTVSSTPSAPGDPTDPPPPDSTTTTPPPPSGDVVGATHGCPSGGYARLVNVSTGAQLASALSNAQPGDQIRLAGGRYTGGRSWSRSGTASAPITLCALPGVTTILSGGQFKITGSFWTITGLVFEGPDGSQNNVYISGSHDFNFVGNEVRGSDWHAGMSVELVRNATIAYNYIHDNGRDHSIDHGIYFRRTAGPGNRIVENLLLRNAARGLSMHDNGGGAINDVFVAQNTSAGNGSTGILVNVNAGTGDVVANNIAAGNGDQTGQDQIRVLSGTSLITHNLTWSASSALAGIENSTSSSLVGNKVGNPLFMAPYGDVRVQAGSPAVGMADPSRVVSPDFTGKVRDSSPDVGAYER
jgi:hypothetical protein